MALSLTCTCGAKLEIDDAFVGKTITCPDCSKELATAPQAVWASHTSGYAIASLILALGLGFTVVGGLAAILCGIFALGHIARYPDRVGGRKFAMSGIILGAVFLLLSLAAYLSPEVLTLDGIFREIEWARKLSFPEELRVVGTDKDAKAIFSITRASAAWGIAKPLGLLKEKEDDKVLVNPWYDAQVVCLTDDSFEAGEKIEDLALERFLKSELFMMFKQPPSRPEAKTAKPKTETPKAEVRYKKDVAAAAGPAVEMVVDLNTTLPPRTFLLRAIKVNEFKIYIVAGGTRRSHFERLEPELRQIVESYRLEK